MHLNNEERISGYPAATYNTGSSLPLASLFLGPHAENERYWEQSINKVLLDYIFWRKNYYPKDGYMLTSHDMEKSEDFYRSFSIQLEDLLNVLKHNFPFFSPRYMAHMLSEQTLPAVIGYFATMLYNPNNVTEEAAPVTVEKEIEFGERICDMLGYSSTSWAHLCSGGSAANLEALWVARQSQFFPLILRDICIRNKWQFRIKLPNSSTSSNTVFLSECSDRQLLHLKPNESIYMLANLSEYLRKEKQMSTDAIMDIIQRGMAASKYNIRTQGYANVLARTHLRPVVFVPQSAHYSLKKTVNILGYGEDAIRPIPTDETFRINIEELEKMLRNVKEDEYIAAVIAVFGTTEEGAIDPVHRVKWLRDSLAQELNISFWLHVDAAWGGYFAVMKHDCTKRKSRSHHKLIDSDVPNFFETVDDYIADADISEEYVIRFDDEIRRKNGELRAVHYQKKKRVAWNDREVFAAMFALPAADSITVDPHKMGYIPYPAGLVAFKNKRIVYLLEQDATYIGTNNKYIQGGNSEEAPSAKFYKRDDSFKIRQVGAYALEGSRPGAAAMSCWFASQIIPLDRQHHGKIIRTSVLNARKFAQLLQHHRKPIMFDYIDRKVSKNTGMNDCQTPFVIELLYNNIDTNLVCFFVRPGKWVDEVSSKDHDSSANYSNRKPGKQVRRVIRVDDSWSLEQINRINKRIAENLTISPSKQTDSRKASLYQKFYVARTEVKKDPYSTASVKSILKRFGFSEQEYERNGIEVLRSTIMNPWYYHASENIGHIDYFMEFLEELHYVARRVIDEEILHKALKNLAPPHEFT